MVGTRGQTHGSAGSLVVALLLSVTACVGDAPGREGGMPGAGDDTPPPAPAPEPTRLMGFLTVEDAPVLTLCGTGEEFTVDGPAYADLLDLHAVLAPGVEPLEGVFVDILGLPVEGERGPAVEALEVRRAAWEGGGCADLEADLAFRASGTEPFWSLSVLGETLTWSTFDGLETLEHRGPYRSDRGDWMVDGTFEAAPPGSGIAPDLRARFYAEPCQDAMSGAWFHMSAEVEYGGVEYQGCAFVGDESLQ